MNITYIHHSAFLVQTESACLLFDWFEGDLPAIPPDKPLYVLASHSHPDHFSEELMLLLKDHPQVIYLLSWEIAEECDLPETASKLVFLRPHETWSDDVLSVETFKSTDEGVAFWCAVDGKQIYHAGDLNHWYWEGEDEQWNRNMTAAYREEIALMAGKVADVAFLPVDPRLGSWFWLGADDYMKQADAARIFPMHFWDDFSVCGKFKEHPCSEGYREKIVTIKEKGQNFPV